MKPTVFGGNILKADELKTGDLIQFKDEGEEIISSKFTYPELTQAGKPHPLAGQPKKELRITVTLSDWQERTLVLNKTSYANLSAVYGYDTTDWIGKQAKVTLIPLPTGKKMISLEPVE